MNGRPAPRMLSCLLATLVLAGCAGTGGQTQARADKAPVPTPSATGRADCFYPREVQRFQMLDRSNLIVYTTGESRAYHVRISPPSIELRNAERLAFVPAGGRICGYAGERLVVAPRGSGPPLTVVDVARLAPESLESLRSGGDGDGHSDPRPQPGTGPDVEGAPEPATPAPGGGSNRN